MSFLPSADATDATPAAPGHRVIAGQALASVPNVNLLIGTPAYAGQVRVDYVSALLGFQRQAIPFTLMTVGNESLITRARNTITSAFHARREFTHLLFLDGDVYLPYEGVVRMLAHGRDVIAAPVGGRG